MTANDEFERYAGSWIREIAGEPPADYLEAVLDRTRNTRQRPAWSSPSRWLPAPLADVRAVPEVRTVALVLALIALLVAFALAISTMGGYRRLPPPYGPAANGLIAFENGGIIYLADADGSRPRPITDGTSFDQQPNWSPDGTRLAWAQMFTRPGTPNEAWFAIYDLERGTRARVHVPGDRSDYWGMAWSPDSRSIAFSAHDQTQGSLFVVDADGMRLRRIELPDSMQGWDVAWSPNGRLLAFTGVTVDQGTSLWVVAPDGMGLHRLTDPSADTPWGIAWSPDGNRIVYAPAHLSSSLPSSLRVVNADGTGDHSIAASDQVGFAAWSPDGGLLAYIRKAAGAPSELVVARPDGSVERVLSLGGLALSTMGSPAWSPDGTKVLAYRDVGTGCATGPCDVRLITVDVATASIATMPALPGGRDATGYDQQVSAWQRVAP